MRLSTDIFAERGDPWNTPNEQHRAVYSTRYGELVSGNEGYGPDGVPALARERRPMKPERRAQADPSPRLLLNRKLKRARRAREIFREITNA